MSFPDDHIVGTGIKDLIKGQDVDGANFGVDSKDAFRLDKFIPLGHLKPACLPACLSMMIDTTRYCSVDTSNVCRRRELILLSSS